MELIAPWNKESLFLTVTEYNSSDEPILAVASVYKDQPFFNTAGGGVYIAAESFRLSAFASDLGYIYQMIKPNWFISGQTRESTDVDPQFVVTAVSTDRIVSMPRFDNVYTTRLGVFPTQYFNDDNSITRHLEMYAKDLNDFRIKENSVIRINPNGSGNREYTVVQDPCEHMIGPGYGVSGLIEVPFRILPELDQDSLGGQMVVDDDDFAENWIMAISVLKKDLPTNTSLEDIKIYFSRGLYCFPDNKENTVQWNSQGFSIIKFMGPYKIAANGLDRGDPFTAEVDEYHGTNQPGSRMWMDEGKYFKTNEAFDYASFKDGMHLQDSFAGVPDDWATELEHAFEIKMCFEWTNAASTALAKTVVAQQVQLNPNGGADNDKGLGVLTLQEYFAYTSQRPLAETLYSEIEIALKSGDQIDGNFIESQLYLLETFEFTGLEVVGRSLSDKEYPALSPNEMFQIFNTQDENSENGWLLNGHANGGFQIEIKKQYDVFTIQKDFADLLGLDPQIISHTKTAVSQSTSENRITVVPCERPDLSGNANSKAPEGNFSNYVTEADIVQFTKWDGSLLNPSTIDTLKGKALQKIGVQESLSWFKLIGSNVKNSVAQKYQRFQKDPLIQIGPDGPEYVYNNVSPGDFIQNLQLVSMESFALFEGIQICVPSLPFQPMITSYSSGMRVLAELRLDFPVGPNPGTDGTNLATNDFWVGDIHWSASNGHQYLQLSTAQQSIFNLEIRAQLVYRDANNTPPKPIWIAPNGGLFQCKIRLVAVK